jgi:hypothetical protein
MLVFFGRRESIRTDTGKQSGWLMVLKNGFDFIDIVLDLPLAPHLTESL